MYVYTKDWNFEFRSLDQTRKNTKLRSKSCKGIYLAVGQIKNQKSWSQKCIFIKKKLTNKITNNTSSSNNNVFFLVLLSNKTCCFWQSIIAYYQSTQIERYEKFKNDIIRRGLAKNSLWLHKNHIFVVFTVISVFFSLETWMYDPHNTVSYVVYWMQVSLLYYYKKFLFWYDYLKISTKNIKNCDKKC